MILRPTPTIARSLKLQLPRVPQRGFLGASATRSNQNRIFDNVRTPNDLHTLTLLSAAENRPLITMWSASWCSTCQAIKPLVKGMIEDERVGQEEGGLGFVEVELDSTLIGDLGVKYMVGHYRCESVWPVLMSSAQITSMPTLLAFSRQEAQFDTRLTNPQEMKNKERLREWLLNEARRGGRAGGGGGGLFGSIFSKSG
ncbi:mitochondrial thioredoxin [Paraphaeosphaeria sporulosa]